ncbi:hypothetical protein BT67DRAFT_386290 [Trichocladium antarcticum]|uniref:Uncharacterized protein n=1 Tax=Trichocladium antarcticum TaxID=1450529 RepID=A0AAN6UFZ7_9PEZI|nr:hypothetical protein BT67DRAFT_386290 [Trichocladium antarcticum]
MSLSESPTPDGTLKPCVLASGIYPHDLYAPDLAADDMDQASFSWMAITVIEDDDLMFGGKPLCTWYEEDRRRLSTSIDEEETRGRQRERDPVASLDHLKPDHPLPGHDQHRHDSKSSELAKG